MLIVISNELLDNVDLTSVQVEKLRQDRFVELLPSLHWSFWVFPQYFFGAYQARINIAISNERERSQTFVETRKGKE